MKSVIPTPEQMDAHERLQWAAWHEQQRQERRPPADHRPDSWSAVERRAAAQIAGVLVVMAVVAAVVFGHVADAVRIHGQQSSGPHLRLDLKTAGVPQ